MKSHFSFRSLPLRMLEVERADTQSGYILLSLKACMIMAMLISSACQDSSPRAASRQDTASMNVVKRPKLDTGSATGARKSVRPDSANGRSVHRYVASYAPFGKRSETCPFMVGSATMFCANRDEWPSGIKDYRKVSSVRIIKADGTKYLENRCSLSDDCLFYGNNSRVFDAGGVLKSAFQQAAISIDLYIESGDITAVRVFKLDETLEVLRVECFGSGVRPELELAFCRGKA